MSPVTTDFKRINVSVSPEMVDAIKNVMENDHVGLTEAVRRLVSYGDFLYRKSKTPGQELMIREGETLRGVYLLP